MYSENSIGPKIDPCGTPRASTSASDSEPFTQQQLVTCYLSILESLDHTGQEFPSLEYVTAETHAPMPTQCLVKSITNQFR